MHRGSSKGVPGTGPVPETLPLSASPSRVEVVLELTRGGRVDRRQVDVAAGTLVRTILRSSGQSPEGCAVLINEVSVPLDTPIDRDVRMVVIPTFSGG
jgi:sulfur carrier protein ThiS